MTFVNINPVYRECKNCNYVYNMAVSGPKCPSCGAVGYRGDTHWEEDVDPRVDDAVLGNPMDDQVGGQHYKSMAIQPTEYIQRNKMGWCEGNIVKYISRHENKNGREDVEKVIHYAKLLLQLEY